MTPRVIGRIAISLVLAGIAVCIAYAAEPRTDSATQPAVIDPKVPTPRPWGRMRFDRRVGRRCARPAGTPMHCESTV
jgi:hypothetical protein